MLKKEEEFLIKLLFKENKISQQQIKGLDFENLIKLLSEHLIIPLFYFKISQKGYINFLPKDFYNYVWEIFEINRQRNKTLIKEIKKISKILNDKNIFDFIFLKGSALIISDLYDDIGIRMVGDIDILMKKRIILEGFDILEKNGYKTKTLGFDINNSKNHLHEPRQSKSDALFPIEIHSRILKKQINFLNPNEFFENKRRYNQLYIPSIKNQFLHNIYNFQINDLGSKKINYHYRNLYDNFLLSKKYKLNTHEANYFIKSYFVIAEELGIYNKKIKGYKMLRLVFRLYKKFRIFGILNGLLINLFYKIKYKPKQFFTFLTNKNYRAYLLMKLRSKISL